MKFSKVQIEHIDIAIKDSEVKGYPEGFKQSAYFDVLINDVKYPPKPIMAYANYHATGEKPNNNFSGGRYTLYVVK
jgi:5-methylcytosine-specific restriction protein B